MHRFLLCAIAALNVGCASVIEGVTQTVVVEVVPSTGSCEVTRDGERLGMSTPQQRHMTISKSKNSLTFACSAPGYLSKTETLSSNLSAATVGSFFLLDLGIVDAATGAWMKYPDRITVVLNKA